ncbi:hypothetical protein [Marinospirillum insulare]|nr:hypothetical protein [Marinospirillum insulare]
MKLLKYFLTCTLLMLVVGCASHSNKMEDAKTLIRYGEYSAAAAEMNELLNAERNKLLKEVELGVLNQLKGDYLASLEHLEVADRLADELYTVSFADLATRASTNATFTTYRGNIVERVYINYFKMLNYFYLAEQATSQQETQALLDSARVEARRAMILLDENVFKVGDYALAKEEKESALYKLQRVFAAVNGSVVNPKELVFRDNAFSHYLIGTLFEKMGERDSARVSYERSAKLYEQGYVKQYQLDKHTASQAWFDTARMLKATGDRRWNKVAKDKLSSNQRNELNQSAKGQGQLVVIQEVDMIAPRGELNLWVLIQNNRLVIRPIVTGTPKEQAYQLAWFYYLYADKGLLGVIERISAEDYLGLLTASHEKKLPIPGVLRSTLESIGLLEAMSSTGIRLSVPLLYYEELPVKKSYLTINGKNLGNLHLADNISGLAMAQHLVAAQAELTNAMAIEALRLSLCMQTGAPAPLCALAAGASTSADTRSWLSLPYEIRTLRTQLPAGDHQIKLTSDVAGYQIEQKQSVKIEAGKVHLVRLRTFAVDPSQPIPDKVKKVRKNNGFELTNTK